MICDDIDALLRNEEFWNGYHGNGEPYGTTTNSVRAGSFSPGLFHTGIIHLNAMKRMGRTDETQYPDPDVEGCMYSDVCGFNHLCRLTIRALLFPAHRQSVQVYARRFSKLSRIG